MLITYRSEKYQQTSEIETSVSVSVERTAENCQLKLGRLFNTAYFVAKEGLSFRKYPKLCSFQSKNDIVLGKNYLTDVACGRFTSSIGESLKDNLRESFNSALFLVLSDGSTDSRVTYDNLENGCPQTKFAETEPPIRDMRRGCS